MMIFKYATSSASFLHENFQVLPPPFVEKNQNTLLEQKYDLKMRHVFYQCGPPPF